MPLSASESERAERVLIRNIAKRDSAVSQMGLLHELAKSVQHDKNSIPIFRARKRDIDVLFTQFHTEQDAILDLLIQLKRNSEYDSVHAPIGITMSNQYYSIIAIADECGIGAGPSLDNSMPTGNPHEGSRIQLPKIQLPSFDGDILCWVAFRDTYKSLVHDNASLSKIEKFHYLLSAVSGSANAVVRSISLSENNYDVAWTALNDRFDNPRLIMNSHLDKLFSFSPLASSSLDNLKNFLDTFQENIAALNGFEIPDKEGFLFFYIASRVLDTNTKCLFESQHHKSALPVIGDLLTFVQTRCQVLENSSVSATLLSPMKTKANFQSKKNFVSTKTSLMVNASEPSKSCFLCTGPHYLYRCEKFLQQPVAARLKIVQSHRLCRNCLNNSHDTSRCLSKFTCRHCSAKHHSLLHFDSNKQKKPSSANVSSGQSPSVTPASSSPTSTENHTSSVFVGLTSITNLSVLGTASIRIRDKCGQWILCRALIDSGSQVSAITQSCASQLGLARRRSKIEVVGLSHTPISQIKGIATCRFISRTMTSPEYSCEPIVLHKITGTIPAVPLNPCIRSQYSDLEFADPSFDLPGRIDFLLGADVYHQIFMDGYRVQHVRGFPSAFETRLGWIFMGTTSHCSASLPQTSLTLCVQPSLDRLLHRFWTVEEPVIHPTPFTEEQKCEHLFVQTTVRDQEGRYAVAFPFKTDPSTLGESRTMALSRFLNMERKLQSDQELYTEYRLFMDEYIRLGHMQLALSPGRYIIPHHAVVKSVNNKIKLRVVFDASARTSSGSSLNDIVFTGQKLQQDISTLLMYCRLQRYMFTADICKMYRQIHILSADRQYQHILWRNDPSEPLCEYALSTVTYGVACSPFQAIRVLHQLEMDEGANYPAAQKVLSSQTYVDDIITGANSVQSVLTLQKQVRQLLGCGGFELKKWASNCPEVLQNIPTEDQVIELSFDPKDDSFVKILGLHWNPAVDEFSYHSVSVNVTTTKRSVLSSIAKIYDPLGTLAPVTFWAKCFMQRLWKEGYSWDHPLSEELSSSWKLFSSELPCVSNIKIPRYIPVNESNDAQLIGFSDASLKGYAAVVYLRLTYETRPTTIHLITAKSKVAPIKSGRTDESLSVPRLELCGALLLAQVLHRVQQIIIPTVNLSSIHAWTDSTVVLSWLTSSQVQFKVFVTNRLNKIQELLPTCQWHHVPTSENPADCVSRGMFPKEAILHSLYWDGPCFLHESPEDWSLATFPRLSSQLPEVKTVKQVCLLSNDLSNTDSFMNRFSSLTRLQRSLAYSLRFVYARFFGQPLSQAKGPLSCMELNRAMCVLVRITQKTYFPELLKQLMKSDTIITPPTIAQLAPFLDESGLIRVGGRLRCSALSPDAKHPYLLPKSSHLTSLLIRNYHLNFLHAGPKLIVSMLRQKFWIISGRDAVRRCIFTCVNCTRHKSQHPKPFMSDLPMSRVQLYRPFSNVGMDYGGPFLVKERRRRNVNPVKVYVALFICMSTKAVHLELVSDLTSDAFLAALDRFVARRGIPSDLYSDCGTNYVGAARQLKMLFNSVPVQNQVSSHLSCNWHFNPPAAPHFGGLWEAAIKSVKFHLRHVIGSQIFTYEEFLTLAIRVEGILNTRPLTPSSSDPHDLTALTPGHFLIGQPLGALPDTDISSIPMNRLSRWELIKQSYQVFWKRWSREYLTTLQGRQKWFKKEENLKVDDLVIVEAPNCPPADWRLGRVTAVHPGPDQVVRVVTIRTSNGIIKRPVVKLVRLPIED